MQTISQYKIGAVLRDMREARHLSVNEVAEQTGLRASIIRAVECGFDPEVSVAMIAKISGAVGIPLYEVIRKALDSSESVL